MDVRIGVLHSMKEIEVELAEGVQRADVRAAILESLKEDDAVLTLMDRQGREVLIPVGRVAYVELGRASTGRTLGFSG